MTRSIKFEVVVVVTVIVTVSLIVRVVVVKVLIVVEGTVEGKKTKLVEVIEPAVKDVVVTTVDSEVVIV